MPATSKRSDYEKRILRVLQYIYENPTGDLSLDNLADIAAMSRFHWHRVFLGLTGETCAQAVRRIRLHLSASMLCHSDLPVGEIAKNIGYPSSRSFIRVFSERYGFSPGVFRKMGRVGPLKSKLIAGETNMFKIEIVDAPKRRLAAIFHKGSYIGIAKHFETLATIAGSRGLWPQVKNVLGVYCDDPNAVAEADLRSYAGLEVDDNFEIMEETQELVLKGGAYAVLHFKGPYTSMQPAYNYLFGEWLANSVRELRDEPAYEVYLNSPSDTKPDDLITKIYMPLV
ncbi:MAG: AraC family transcriptional regulator [Rhizobiales bacterium]|nr:AraC family transcriptional regulator [Hyphomicrobiales bacterium]